ncbi:ArsR/SmtB family transcription factor [Solemya velum gill symbiont]|uniref:Transcriptional regulator n=1 Tax=Solemya velum gill symbiont TaxID=2340 RepID=A0A0B0H6N1_SOVGS|nr:metalloregulator ArsR/SmtB family transcription factor [Solemya velum gill symbiont]KHF24765.1 transcriptional regulator [Solemya velum gill symbiont]OOY34785.1 ArsR family transcriptional regulator [Solemya velum gill symbiont]OOY37676.1 ArsR family transcriptional regulator [Solemya velum gill symbiont]OOY39790.1 ArsR family transcriptional regulator [Solemya velum gill symbiont]OOY42744.1 ArsR family transcriptional regulator [Solemya velum gill symbiont]
MSRNHFKQDLFAQFARVGKALGHGNRLELIEFLAQGERSVDELARVSGLTVANTSQHLQQLRQAGLVECRKESQRVIYRLSGNDIIDLMTHLRQVAERHLDEVDQLVTTYLTTRDDLEPIPREELLSRVKDGLVTVIDVRPVEEYNNGHVTGAVNIPLNELMHHLDDFDHRQEIVAYCRGPHCILAFDAVANLRSAGIRARRLEDGFPEWQRAGLPVERTEQ